VTTLRQNGVNVSNVAVDGTFQCLPNHPTDLRQLLTVHIIFNNMVIIYFVSHICVDLFTSN